MPWVRFEDDYLGSRKLAKLSTAAIALDMAGIIYSARELRDGHLDQRDLDILTRLLSIRGSIRTAAIAQLVAVQRWSEAPDGYEIHDYLDYQPSREKVLAQREADRERKRTAAEKRWRVRPESDGDSGRIPDAPGPGPGPGSTPPNPPRRARGARQNGRGLSDQDRADLAAMQARAVVIGDSS